MIPKVSTISVYFEVHPKWERELICLHDLLSQTELNPSVKWNSPVYSLDGKNVIGIAAFKNYFGLWFHQGCFLKDEANLLINAQEGVTKALRQMRFDSFESMDLSIIESYIQEAIQNQKDGKVLKIDKTIKFEVCSELKTALDSDEDLKNAYEQLTPGKKKEYALHISQAKQQKTRLSRLDKIVPMILEGKGLNDKYKKC